MYRISFGLLQWQVIEVYSSNYFLWALNVRSIVDEELSHTPIYLSDVAGANILHSGDIATLTT
jgi:hypothetical protein